MGTAPRRAPFETPARRLVDNEVDPELSGVFPTFSGDPTPEILGLTDGLTAAAGASSAAWLAYWGAVMIKICVTLMFFSENRSLKT